LTPKTFWRGEWRPGPRNIRFRYHVRAWCGDDDGDDDGGGRDDDDDDDDEALCTSKPFSVHTSDRPIRKRAVRAR